MQIINKTVKCPQCGCIAFPDAIRCPKCNSLYLESRAKAEVKKIFKSIDSPSTQERDNTNITMIKTYYQVNCPHHGQIDIEAAVIFQL